ncbi:MAG: (2Fe-2S)-binding protein, partial [Alphaproteobacteria bacterium]|nr:(2Fe-2S)-binding protein [Alphaproteobacteria bacterium]
MSEAGSTSRSITVTVNGHDHHAEAPVRLTLADFLRHTLKLT